MQQDGKLLRFGVAHAESALGRSRSIPRDLTRAPVKRVAVTALKLLRRCAGVGLIKEVRTVLNYYPYQRASDGLRLGRGACFPLSWGISALCSLLSIEGLKGGATMQIPVIVNFEVLITDEKDAACVADIADTLHTYGLIDEIQHVTILAKCEDLPY